MSTRPKLEFLTGGPLLYDVGTLCLRNSTQEYGTVRYSSCRYNERQLIHVTVARRVRPRAERSSPG